MAKGIAYTSRNFLDIRTDLINFAKQYYPDIFNDLNDSSIGMMLIELNSAVGDMLSANTDRMFQETQIDYAQERKSILSMARTFGLKIPGKSPSVTLVDFTVTVPVNGDSFDLQYAPIIRSGAQINGAGKTFETSNDIDFSSPFSIGGIPNRIIIPNFDTNGNLLNYTLTKREMVKNGYTKVFKKAITVADVKPFLEVVLPDDNVISIESVITLNGSNYIAEPSLYDFTNINNRWFEMDALAEDKVFIEDMSIISDNPGIIPGKYIKTDKKFIREYTDLGFTKIIFGGGSQDISSLNEFDTNSALLNQIGDFINNLSLGIVHSPNTTLFIKYRVGGGADTNLGQGVLRNLGIVDISVNGEDINKNNLVKSSLKVNNLFPALGGKDAPSVDEVRNLVRYNFSSQNRAVNIKDYNSRIQLMPSEFGKPFRCGVIEIQNKIKVYILGLNGDGTLTSSITSTLKQNIENYLSDYKSINDYVVVGNGRIVNLAFEVDLFIDKQFSQSQIVSQVITDITQYMSVNNFQMGENIYLSALIELINNVGGVLNVIDLRIYNKVGGNYSLNEITQPYLDAETRQIDVSADYTLYGEPMTMFEVLNPTKDISVRVK
jgi:hypothetical protein